MQAKLLNTEKILSYLNSIDTKFCVTFDCAEYSIWKCIPKKTPYKVMIAKMRSLIKRGLVDGCGCGCRGDFVITKKGKDYLKDQRENSQDVNS